MSRLRRRRGRWRVPKGAWSRPSVWARHHPDRCTEPLPPAGVWVEGAERAWSATLLPSSPGAALTPPFQTVASVGV